MPVWASLSQPCVLQTALISAALPSGPEEAPARSSLAGQILVATPEMGDPHFEKTVILIAQHDAAGALGIVLNRPIGEETFAGLFDALGEKSAGVTGSVRIYAGGPVKPEVGFVVHSPEYRLPETLAIDDRLSLTSNVKVLRDIANRSGPAKALIAFGYAGWGPGQLDQEIEAAPGRLRRPIESGFRRGSRQSVGRRLEAAHAASVKARPWGRMTLRRARSAPDPSDALLHRASDATFSCL